MYKREGADKEEGGKRGEKGGDRGASRRREREEEREKRAPLFVRPPGRLFAFLVSVCPSDAKCVIFWSHLEDWMIRGAAVPVAMRYCSGVELS